MKPLRKSPSYLIRNSYSYCFRMNVPRDLQQFVGRKELRYSLNTGYLGLARCKAWLISGQVHLMFMYLRRRIIRLSEPSEEKIQELIQQYIRDYINGLEEVYIKQDLKSLQETVIEDHGKSLAVRTECIGTCGKTFQAVGVAVPSTIREL